MVTSGFPRSRQRHLSYCVLIGQHAWIRINYEASEGGQGGTDGLRRGSGARSCINRKCSACLGYRGGYKGTFGKERGPRANKNWEKKREEVERIRLQPKVNDWVLIIRLSI